MPPFNNNINDMNQQFAPFWDFVARMQEQANSAGLTDQMGNNDGQPGSSRGPWVTPDWPFMAGPFGGYGPGQWGGMPYRGRHGPPPPPPPPPPPAPAAPEAPPPPPHHDHEKPPIDGPLRPTTPPTPDEGVPECPGEGPRGPPGPPKDDNDNFPHRGPPGRGRCHGGPWRGFGGNRHSHGHGHHGPRRHGGPCGPGSWPHGNSNNNDNPWSNHPLNAIFSDPSNLGDIVNQFVSHLIPQSASAAAQPNNTRGPAAANNDGSFSPAIDVFATPTAYILHASLPGAQKGDVAVSYSAASHAITISGVVARPEGVDEDMLSTLAVSERDVGVFERVVRLGDFEAGNIGENDKSGEGYGTGIYEEGIVAKLEDGVLKVHVPRKEKEWVEVTRVDVE